MDLLDEKIKFEKTPEPPKEIPKKENPLPSINISEIFKKKEEDVIRNSNINDESSSSYQQEENEEKIEVYEPEPVTEIYVKKEVPVENFEVFN